MKKAALNFLMWSAGATLLLVVLALLAAALGLSWLGGSEEGRGWIAEQISARVSSDGLIVEVGDIKTLNSRKILISRLAFKDRDGELLTLENVEIGYAVEYLLAGNFHINYISVENALLSRIPESSKDKEGATFLDIPDLHIEKFEIERINLAPAITGKEEILALEGMLILSPHIKKSDLELQLQDKNTGNMLADITFAPDEDGLTLKASIHDEGQGFLARLSGLPMIDVSFEGTGTLQDWQGTLLASTGKDFKSESRVVLDLKAKRPTFKLTGVTTYDAYKTDGETELFFHLKAKKLDVTFKGNLETPEFRLENFSLKGQAEYKKQRINIASLQLTTSLFYVTADGYVDTSDQSMKLNTKTNIADLKVISSDLSGSGVLDAQVSGGYEPLNLKSLAHIQTQNFQTIWGEVNEALGLTPNVKADLSYIDDKLEIKGGVLKGAALKALDFSGGISKNKTTLDIATNYQGYDLKTVINLKGSDLVFEPINITGDIGALTGRAGYDLDQEKVQAALTLKPDDNNVFSVNLSGSPQNLYYIGDWKGKGAYPLNFKYKGSVKSEQKPTVKLTAFTGDYGSNRFALKAPAQLVFQDGGAMIENFILGMKDGVLKASGKFSAKEFSADFKAENLPANLDIFPFIFDGRVVGELHLSGPYSTPVGQAAFDLKRIAVPGLNETENRYVDGNLTASYKNNILTVDTDLSGPAELKFKAKGRLPLSISPFGIPSDKPISGTLNSSVDLKALSLLLGLDEHSIAGRSTLNVILSGTLNKPLITGNGNLRNGTYQNLLLGTHFKDITGDVIANENRLMLKSLAGSDINGGRFTGSGHIDFRNIRDPQYQFTLDTKNLQLVNTDRMGMVASGKLVTEGDMGAANLKGQIAINQAEYYIAQIISTNSLSSFTIIEENGNGDKIAQEEFKQNVPNINLSIGIKADNNVYVRGPDLETEWSGKLNVTGTAKEPDFKGNLSLVRGRFQLLDTPVQLSKGSVRFANADPTNPDIDVSGTIKGRDMDAILRITGEAKTPEIGLQSEPPLPEDEILAKTLFGSSVTQLSPVQALRIAQLMAYISGQQEASLDPLNDIRRAIGIDTLSVGMDDGKGATLSVGKYVSDKVYIGVDQGTTPGSSAVRAEIEVTDDIEVETKTDSTNESSIGVNWKRDY